MSLTHCTDASGVPGTAYGVVVAAYISPVVGENYITYLHVLIQPRVTGDPRSIDLLEYMSIVSNLRMGAH